MSDEAKKAPEIVLLKSEMEAAAARVAERALNNTVDGIGGFVADIFGGVVGDGIKQWRTRRLIDVLFKTKEHLESKGIRLENTRALPQGELFAIFEGASKQVDPDLATMWAALLANAMNPESDIDIDPQAIRLLENLSGLDALIINTLHKYEEEYSLAKIKTDELMKGITFSTPLSESVKERTNRCEEIMNKISENLLSYVNEIEKIYNEEKISSAIANLLRAGLLDYGLSVDKNYSLLKIVSRGSIDYGDISVDIDESELKGLLSAMIKAINPYTNSDESKYSLIAKVSHVDRYWPVFELSALGRRIVKICT